MQAQDDTSQNIPQRKQAEEEHRKAFGIFHKPAKEANLKVRKPDKGFLSRLTHNSRVEKALFESHERLLSIVETANDPIIGSDGSGNIIMWNSAATRAFGYSAEEAINQPITILMPERFRKLHENALERAVAVQRLYYAKRVREVFGRRKDGTEFPVEVSISGWKTREGMFFTAIIRDISERVQKDEELQKANEELESRVLERTAALVKLNESLRQEIAERRRVEEMLRNSEQLYHALVEEVPDVIFILDNERRFTFLNAQAEDFFKRPIPEMLGTQLCSYVVPGEREKIMAISDLHPDSICDEEVRMLDADGRRDSPVFAARPFHRAMTGKAESITKG